MSLKDRIKPHIRDLAPYVPGKPIETLERELGIHGSIKLASNENPWGGSPKALEALRANVHEIQRYPDGASHALRAKLAERLGVEPAQLVFGCGGDEILELIAKTTIGPGDEVVMPWPSFAMYPIVTKGMGGVPVMVPLDDAYEHDFPAMLDAITEKTTVVMVCNPNNPTGTTFGKAAFDEFVRALPEDVILAIDEAYYEFARREDFPESLPLLKSRPGTIVIRTFSKLYGLAGLRVGYGIADVEFASYLERARHPFNVNRLAEIAALAALDDHEHVKRTLEGNAQGIDYLTRELTAMGLRVWPSEANYVLCEAGEGMADALLRLGVIVRPMNGFGLPACIRISIGTAQENERAVKAIAQLRTEGPHAGEDA